MHVEQQIRERPSISVFRWVHLLTEVHVKKEKKEKEKDRLMLGQREGVPSALCMQQGFLR